MDEYVIDYACEVACLKVANITQKCSPGGGGGRGEGGGGAAKCPQEHPVCTDLLRRSREGRERRTTAARCGGAPMASYDKRRHRNCF